MRTVSHLKVNLRDKVARAAATLDARRELKLWLRVLGLRPPRGSSRG